MNATVMAMKAVRIEQELIDTEKSYLEGLNCLMDEFIEVIFEENMMNNNYRKQIICNIPELITFHTQFLEELRVGNIAKVFNKQADYFKMYIEYVVNYNNVLNIFAKEKKNKRLQKFLETKRSENKSLISHLILPIQRIPRYMLLLNELRNKTPKSHEFEYRDITNALKKVQLICNEINEKHREIENMSQCLLVSNKLKGLNINIVEAQRKYIDHFIFKQKLDKKNKEFFIFNDIIIISDIKWRVEQIVKITQFEAKRPSKKNEEVLIRIIQGHNRKNSNLNDIKNRNNSNSSKGIESNKPIPFIVANDIPIKDQHENISNIDLFIQLLNNYRTKLYKNEMSRAYITNEYSDSNNYNISDTTSPTNNNNNINMNYNNMDIDDSLVEMIREEQEKHKLAQWQESKSKGNKNKVLSMLKSPSEDTY